MKKIPLVLALGLFAAASASLAQDGKAVYTAQKCQMCHSIAGEGNKKSPLDGVGKKLSAADLRKWVVAPKEMKADSKMKAYPNLPAKELDALVAYMQTLK